MSLTAEGFDRKRLNEIKADLDASLIAALGPVNTSPDSVLGEISGITAAAFDDVWEGLQNNYDSMYPYTASGVSLDNAVSLIGISRLGATATSVIAMAYGTIGTVINDGAIARATDNRQYAAVDDVTISASNAGDVYIEVLTVTNSATYQIVAGGVTVSYVADSDTDADEILAGLLPLFDDEVFITEIVDSKLRIRSINEYTDFTITMDGKLGIETIGSPVPFVCLDLGKNALPVGSLNTIVTLISGWDSVLNLIDGATGRNIETDTELRARHRLSVRVIGAATVQAMRARIAQDVDSVTFVSVYENRSNFYDGLMPPHSVEVVVSGGSNEAVALKIWEVKPAGIQTYGNTSIQVLDDNGDLQLIRFSRPDDKYAWVRVSVDSLYTEETLTAAAVIAIQNAVLAYGNSLGIGNDIITQRFYGPIYGNTSGIGSITVEVAVTDDPEDTPSYSISNIAIGRNEVAIFDVSRIDVVGVV